MQVWTVCRRLDAYSAWQVEVITSSRAAALAVAQRARRARGGEGRALFEYQVRSYPVLDAREALLAGKTLIQDEMWKWD